MFTKQEAELIRECLSYRIDSLQDYANNYPDGGYSQDVVDKAESIASAIYKKLN